MTKKATAVNRKSTATKNKQDFQITSDLIAYGVKIMKQLDSSINHSKDLAQKEKNKVVSNANKLIEYLSGFGVITSPDQLELIKNTLYDQLNWRRLGGETGTNKGRIKGNPTITKYFSILKGYVELKGRLHTTKDFSEIRTIYQDRGSRKLQREFKYNHNKIMTPIYSSLNTLKQSNQFQKEFTTFIIDFAKKNKINLET